MKESKNQILIGYTNRLFADGLESIIEAYGEFTVVRSEPIHAKFIDLVKRSVGIEALILEMEHISEIDFNIICDLMNDQPNIHILLISHMPCAKLRGVLIESGIEAYLLKTCGGADLLIALRKIMDGKFYFCSEIIKAIMIENKKSEEKKQYELTHREEEILSMLIDGKNNIEIARKMSLSENTVKTHRKHIFTKFGVNNLLGMVRYACAAQLINHGREEFCKNCPCHLQSNN